jgi:DNA invertase Pin-like site-specific DNA recombinase
MPRRASESPEEIVDRLVSLATSPSKRPVLSALAQDGEQALIARQRPLRVAAYCRYSSAMQNDGWSIPMQHTSFEQEAQAQTRDGVQWDVDYFDEPAKSATDRKLAKRTVFLRMLRAALSGEYDIVAVYKLDRFSRSEIVTLLALGELERAGVRFVSLQEKFDANTPAGWMALRFIISMTEGENRKRGGAIADGKAERVMKGLYACRVPYGYRKNLDAVKAALERMGADPRAATKALGQAGAEPDVGGTWEGLMCLYALMRECLTDGEIAERMNRDGHWPAPLTPGGGKKANEARVWTRQTVSVIRRNRFYRPFTIGDPNGTVVSKGRTYRGTHAAALSWEEWHALQQIAEGRRRGWTGHSAGLRPEPYTAEFRGLVVCAECGGVLYVRRTVHDTAKDGVKRIYERYVCDAADRGVQCSQSGKWARVEDVRAAWLDWLGAQALPEAWEQAVHARAVTLARNGDTDGRPDGQADTRERMRELAKAHRRREANNHLYALGEIERDEFDRRHDAISKEISRLEGAGQTVEQHVTRLMNAASIIHDAVTLWRDELTLAERQAIAARMIEAKGMPLILRASKGYYNRWIDASTLPPSCELGTIRLRPDFAEAFSLSQVAREAVG